MGKGCERVLKFIGEEKYLGASLVLREDSRGNIDRFHLTSYRLKQSRTSATQISCYERTPHQGSRNLEVLFFLIIEEKYLNFMKFFKSAPNTYFANIIKQCQCHRLTFVSRDIFLSMSLAI